MFRYVHKIVPWRPACPLHGAEQAVHNRNLDFNYKQESATGSLSVHALKFALFKFYQLKIKYF